MARINFFPEVGLKSGSVRILGFWHGYAGDNLPTDVRKSLGTQVANFRPQDYLMIEGSPFAYGEEDGIYSGELQPTTTEEGVVYQGTLHRDHTEYRFPVEPNRLMQALLQVPDVGKRKNDFDLRTEWPEFYFSTILWNGGDQQIASADQGSLEDKRWLEVTFATPEETEALKQARIAFLDGKIDGITREQLKLYFEKEFTGRSLLLARIAAYRAQALGSYPLGGEVELFLGCMHSGEALRFLKHPEAAERYLSRTHPEIRDVYEQNESMQQEITEAFHASVGRQRLRPQERTLVMKGVVDNAMERYMQLAAKEGTKVIRV